MAKQKNFATRLSGALESFGVRSEFDEEKNWLKQCSKSCHFYQDLKIKFLNSTSATKELSQEMIALEHCSREFAAQSQERESSDLVNNACLTLLEIFHNSNDQVVDPSSGSSYLDYDYLGRCCVRLNQKEMGGINCLRVMSDRKETDEHKQTGKRWRFTLVGLIEELSASFDDVDSISNALFSLLRSDRSVDELQAELADLLGYDKLDLLRQILEHRTSLVDEYFCSSDSFPSTSFNSGRSTTASRMKKAAPALGQQITVQSENERLMAKDIRKYEKKMAKADHTSADCIEELNIEELRRKELALAGSQSAPLFRQEAAELLVNYVNYQSRCPYVFDALEEMGKLSAVIGTSKVMLPEGMIRKVRGNYEEISLPPSSPAPVNVGRNKVKIEELDEVCQLAFKGTKELNRIQSVVFERAYRDTENLLICAPTGAGKTNIAMLAILRVIRDHIENGIIKKDKFKIIYIAPMKALAAEMVKNFGNRLSELGISVRELTGDMQLTKTEILKTQVIVTTPEKWDVVTRKSTGDISFTNLVKLLIIDEVHLLHDDRGPVIETLVARTLRQVEIRQTRVRIVALSATLPNYRDVAHFLHINPEKGLFFFDGRFRPVPLSQTFIGVKNNGGSYLQSQEMDRVCYEKLVEFMKEGQQVLVFVHARNATGRLANALKEMAADRGQWELFVPNDSKTYGIAQNTVMKSRNRQLQELFSSGFAIHHAGMLRQDRTMVERLFSEGHIRVLVCTSTLAWGVNLPAHAVIIKGTEVYVNGAFVDLGILDVQQIFGRAGRPQFDSSGHGIIITSHDKLYKYLSYLTRQMPIESQFSNSLIDNLNAEIVLGTVCNMEEAITWLSFTYFYIRMSLNPLAYGISLKEKQQDPDLYHHRRSILEAAAIKLDQYEMIRYDHEKGVFYSTDLGRTASHFYVKSDTIETVLHGDGPLRMSEGMSYANVLAVLSGAQEFRQLKIREEEKEELDYLERNVAFPILGGSCTENGCKVNSLLQARLTRVPLAVFSLISDTSYIAQNAGRIVRALFEMALRRCWAVAAFHLLEMSKAVEQEMRPDDHVFLQYPSHMIRRETVDKLAQRKLTVHRLKEDLEAKEIGNIVRDDGRKIKELASKFPHLLVDYVVRPLTSSILQITLEIAGDFCWDDRIHGKGMMGFWLWMSSPEDNFIYHYEYFLLHKKQVIAEEPQRLIFTIPVNPEKLPSQYNLQWSSDRFVGCQENLPVSFQSVILPVQRKPHTELLNLRPLDISVLEDVRLESLYSFSHFNAVQTQIFHCLYHTDYNVLLGAPTGSGKTVAAELALFRMLREQPGAKCVYIAPLKALVRERLKDWRRRLGGGLGLKLVELTGDFTPDVQAITESSVIVTTPEKWDGISRSWQTRKYVKDVALMVIDEIHLLGEERGPALEVIIARTNFMVATTGRSVRVVALSTALANANDLADWLDVKEMNMVVENIKDHNLKLSLSFGIGMHHAGLNERDRTTVEELFLNQKIQVLIATATLAWGVNLPAHLVIIKGTEYFDGKKKRYTDFPVTDVLQMMGRAGRPQFDSEAVAVIYVQDTKKPFYKKFLHEPFPVESSLLNVLADHLNAEIVAGTVNSKQEAVDYLTWTYFFRRLLKNPSYYELENVTAECINRLLTGIIDQTLKFLELSHCVGVLDDNRTVRSLILGQIASFYYLQHTTVKLFRERLHKEYSVQDLLKLLCDVPEYDEIPVRHNEEEINAELAQSCPWEVPKHSFDDPHTKTNLLYQAHFCSLALPITDYQTDLKSVLDQSIRILQAMLDVCAEQGWLSTSLRIVRLIQMVVQGCRDTDPPVTCLPHINAHRAKRLGIRVIAELKAACKKQPDFLQRKMFQILDPLEISDIENVLKELPDLCAKVWIRGWWKGQTRESKKQLPIIAHKDWAPVHADQEYVLSVDLQRLNKKRESRAYAPRFPKIKDEGWIVMLGDKEQRELLALKRVGFVQRRSTVNLLFCTPAEAGRKIYSLFLLSDCYLGLDQRLDLPLELLDPSVEAQVNTEVNL